MEDQPQRIREFIGNLEWRRWKQVFLLFLLLTITVIAIGSSTTLSVEEGSELLEEFESRLPQSTTQPIFTNNFVIAVLMFVPGLGPAAGVLILYTTGVVIAATGLSVNLPGILLLLALLLLPFAWLEFISYSIAMTQSVFLVVGFVRRSVKRELVRTGLLLIVVFAMLLAGAFIEALFIQPE
ncbi:MAG: stage II sporulation protein M [Nitrososphaerales archaeon]